MCYDKYAKELGDREFGDGLLIYEEAEPKTVELKFVANARKGGTNWKKFSKESDKKKMGKPHEAVPLIIPYTIVANGKQFRKDCVHWDDAIKFRRTTQLAYLTMFKDSLPDIDDVCAGLRIRRPDSHIFFVIKLAVDDTTN